VLPLILDDRRAMPGMLSSLMTRGKVMGQRVVIKSAGGKHKSDRRVFIPTGGKKKSEGL